MVAMVTVGPARRGVGPGPYRGRVVEVVLPVLDEAEALPWVLARMPTGYRALVVDNGSSDGSGPLAASLGALVVHEPRQGFGAACWAGLTAARAELVCFMDADGSLDPAELPAVVGPVARGSLDLCLGRRRPVPGAMALHVRMGNQVVAARLRRRSGVALRDLGPMRAARRADLLALELADRRFGWPLEMVLEAAARGWRVGEVAVTYRARSGGRSKVTGTLGGSLRASRDMARMLREHRGGEG